MKRAWIRTSLVLAAVIATSRSASGDAANDIPAVTGDFLAYCQENYQGCEDQVTSSAVDLIMTQNPNFCDPQDDYPDDLTNAVIAWLTARPEIRGQALSKSIVSALIATRPCKKQ
jgi:hypothetical protein